MNQWNIYEVYSKIPIHGVKFRGRVRKFAIENNIELLIENATDKENVVRFALNDDNNLSLLQNFISTIAPKNKCLKVLGDIENPVLSKLKVNDITRYE